MDNILTPGLFLLLLIFSSASLLISSAQPSRECHPNDHAALMEFKAAFPSNAFATWDSRVSCCGWLGVTCNTVAPHRVTEITVRGQNTVRGSIPPAIGRLVFLQQLIFRELPNLVGSIPHEITNLKSLRNLFIADTGLSTPIPSFFQELPVLDLLVLSRNNHSGPIPRSILQNGILNWYLDLSGNNLSGPIPPEFGKIDFRRLDLSGNQLTGDASFLFGLSKTASTIDLSTNQLDFELTNVVFSRNSLQVLRLNNNHIRGIIPPQIANVFVNLMHVIQTETRFDDQEMGSKMGSKMGSRNGQQSRALDAAAYRLNAAASHDEGSEQEITESDAAAYRLNAAAYAQVVPGA